MATRKTKKEENKEAADQVIESVAKEEAPKKAKATAKKVADPFFVHEGQTEVASRRKLINLLPNTKTVKVENLGGGDLYVGATNIDFTAENLVRIGESKELSGVSYFYLGSLSRPTYRISHFE